MDSALLLHKTLLQSVHCWGTEPHWVFWNFKIILRSTSIPDIIRIKYYLLKFTFKWTKYVFLVFNTRLHFWQRNTRRGTWHFRKCSWTRINDGNKIWQSRQRKLMLPKNCSLSEWWCLMCFLRQTWKKKKWLWYWWK